MIGSHPIFDLDGWQAPTVAVQLSSMPPGPRKRQRLYSASWMNMGELDPVDLYCYLRARFGEPKGYFKTVRHRRLRGVLHWHYKLLAHHSKIEVLGSTRGIQFYLVSEVAFSPNQWPQLAQAIKQDMGKYGSRIGAVRRSLQKWSLFVNPFARNQRTTKYLTTQLRSVKLEEPTPLPARPQPWQVRRFDLELRAWFDSVREASSIALSLRMMAPVLIESFINLLLFILARDELRRDVRLYESVLRSHVDIRVRGIHLHCRGFANPVDPRSDAFIAFHTLMNRRNDLLHGNIDPRSLMFGEMFLDADALPLFPDHEPSLVRLGRNFMRNIEPMDALRDIQVAWEFIDFMFSCLEPAAEKIVRPLSSQEQLGWHPSTAEVRAIVDSSAPIGFAVA